MPTYRAKIFNQFIDLNYDERDKAKLLKLIDTLNNHWKKYKNLQGKANDKKIMILLALELQDALFDLEDIQKINKERDKKINSKNNNKNNNSAELILHKDRINNLESKINNFNSEFEEINKVLDEINSDLEKMSKSIISSYDN